MSPRTKNLAVLVAKLLVAAVLIGWLVQGGKLDPTSLRILVDRPGLLVLDLALFLYGAFVGTFRFRVLLGLAGVEASVSTLFRLQMTAFFFNTVIPGNIGGDVVKALYVARDAPPEKRTTILLLTFVERLLGVIALVLMGSLILVLRGSAVLSDPILQPLAPTVLFLGGATVVGGLGGLAFVRLAGARLDVYTSGPSRLAKLLNQLVTSARLVSAGPARLLLALGLSMSFHAAAMAYFTILTHAVLETPIPYSAVATVFPIGLLSLMLPISPAGLGVGHVAFQRLFAAIGLPSGASVFNVYLLGQLAPCFLGVFPFLGLRRRGELPREAMVAPKPSEAENT